MTMKAHTYYIIFGRPPIGGGETSPLPPLAAPLRQINNEKNNTNTNKTTYNQ